jgi:plastocyanin
VSVLRWLAVSAVVGGATLFPEPAGARTVSAAILDFGYQPGEISVAAGDQVNWTNGGEATHTVIADSGEFRSAEIKRGNTFSYAFHHPGTYAYHCGIHPSMRGRIQVTMAALPTTWSASTPNESSISPRSTTMTTQPTNALPPRARRRPTPSSGSISPGVTVTTKNASVPSTTAIPVLPPLPRESVEAAREQLVAPSAAPTPAPAPANQIPPTTEDGSSSDSSMAFVGAFLLAFGLGLSLWRRWTVR